MAFTRQASVTIPKRRRRGGLGPAAGPGSKSGPAARQVFLKKPEKTVFKIENHGYITVDEYRGEDL